MAVVGAVALLAAGVAVGCSKPAAYAQRFTVSLAEGSAGVEGTPVRLVIGEDHGCARPVAEGVTGSDGRVVLEHAYQPSLAERYVVVVHSFGVCFSRDGQWSRVWQLTTGPAPEAVAVSCKGLQGTRCEGQVG